MDNNYSIVEKKALLVKIINDILANKKIDDNSLMKYDEIFINIDEENNETYFTNNYSKVDKSLENLWMYLKDLFNRLTKKELTEEKFKQIIRKLSERLGALMILYIKEYPENTISPYDEYSCMQKILKKD